MPRSFDDRSFPRGPEVHPPHTDSSDMARTALRGRKRLGPIGAIVPADHVEVARELARLRKPRPKRRKPVKVEDRHIEYVFGGPKWKWNDTAQGNNGINWSWVRDPTNSIWGGYIQNGPLAQNGEIFLGVPLGPRFSQWDVNVCLGEGPDFGILDFEVATMDIVHTEEGGHEGEAGNMRMDVEVPYVSKDPPLGWHFADPGNHSIDCYSAATTYDNFQRMGGGQFRIVGEEGDHLSKDGFDATEQYPTQPHTGKNVDGGDGLMWWFRFYVDNKNASSQGYRMRIHAIRFVRVFAGDGYV